MHIVLIHGAVILRNSREGFQIFLLQGMVHGFDVLEGQSAKPLVSDQEGMLCSEVLLHGIKLLHGQKSHSTGNKKGFLYLRELSMGFLYMFHLLCTYTLNVTWKRRACYLHTTQSWWMETTIC